MEAEVSYCVTAQLPNGEVRGQYEAWLLGGHVQAVVAGGATSAEVVRLEGPGFRVQSRYIFPDAAAFDRYVATVAPGLRADGMQRFGGIAGVEFSRAGG